MENAIDIDELQILAHNLPIPCWIASANGAIFWFNLKWHEYCGSTPLDMASGGWQSVLDQDELPSTLALWELLFAAGEAFVSTMRLKGSDGVFRSFLTKVEPARDQSGQIVRWIGMHTDISAQVEVEAKLRSINDANQNSTSYRQAVVAQLAEGVIITDAGGRIIFVNKAANDLHGVMKLDIAPDKYAETYSLFTVDGQPHPAETLPLTRAVLQDETVIGARWLIRRPDGSQVLALGNAQPVYSDSGQKIGAVLTIHDDTARHASEVALAEVVKLKEALLYEVNHRVKNSLQIVYVNDAFERRTGFSRAEVIGKTPSLLQGPKTQRAELERIRNALKNWEPIRTELINYTKAGEEFWLEIDIVPLANDAGWYTHWVAVERDISERKQVEESLKLSEERFRLAIQAAGSAIWEWDVVTDAKWWSEGLQEIFGHQCDIRTNSTDSIRKRYVHPEDLESFLAAHERLLSGHDLKFEETYRFQRGDGTWAIVEDRAFAFLDSAGTTIRVLGSMTDVTERKQLEELLRQSQKMEVIGQLTGGIAHDFNNLLTVILGNAEIMEQELIARPDLRQLARMSLEAADRGAQLTNQLLAFARKQQHRL